MTERKKEEEVARKYVEQKREKRLNSQMAEF